MSPALPELTLACLFGGKGVRLGGPAPGTPVVLDVWGTWCGPCVREVPLLVDLSRGTKGRLTVLGVPTQDTARNGLEFARQFGMDCTSVLDDGGVVMRAYSPGPPVTLFIAGDGRVRDVERGEFKDAAQLAALVTEHLGVASRGPAPRPS